MRCTICAEAPTQVLAGIQRLKDEGHGYKHIWTEFAKHAGFSREKVQAHCAHLEAEPDNRAEGDAVTEYFKNFGVDLPPEGVEWTAASVRGENGNWLKLAPQATETPEDRIEIRQAKPVKIDVRRPSPTVLIKGDWQNWVANPDCQIGYWRDNEGNWHSIHDERCFDLGHQIAQVVAKSDGLHGWLDVGDFMDLAAPSRHNPTAIDLHVDGLNMSTQRASDELARRRWLVGPDGEVIVMGGNHDCLSADTRIVTREGFVAIDDYAGEEVLSVDETGQSVWLRPEAIVRKPFEGKLHRVRSSYYDALMTPNHRVVGYKTNKAKPSGQLVRAEWLASEVGNFISIHAGTGRNADSDISDDDIRLAAWAFTDSHRDSRGRWTLYQSGAKADRLRALLQGVAQERRRQRSTTAICGKTLLGPPQPSFEFVLQPTMAARLNKLVPCRDELPAWVWELSERQVDLLVEEWIYTDGSTKSRGARMIYCSKAGLRRQLMALLAANGYRATETEYRPNHWRINLSKATTAKVDLRSSAACWTELEDYCGEVWCLTVPTGQFFVERNGRVFLTGNCRLPKRASQDMPYLVGLRRPGDPEDEHPILSVPYLVRAREHGVEWVSGYPSVWRALNSNLITFHAPAYGSRALDTARKIAARVHASVIHGHTHRREGLAENIETIKGARTLEIWSDGTWARVDGSLPAANSAHDEYMNRVLAGSLPENQGLLGPNMHQGMSILHVEIGGRERFSVERISIWDGWCQFRGQTFAASCDQEGNALDAGLAA